MLMAMFDNQLRCLLLPQICNENYNPHFNYLPMLSTLDGLENNSSVNHAATLYGIIAIIWNDIPNLV